MTTQAQPAVAVEEEDESRRLPFLAVLDRPLTSYHLIIGTTGLLLAIGLVMVLSTSSATQLTQGGSPYSVFAKQLIGALVGLPMIWVLSRMPPRLLRSIAKPVFIVAICGLVLVQAFGTSNYGAERWITIVGIQIQPSEFAKLALLIWGADLLARKDELKQLNDWRALLVPLLPGSAMLALLVMLGDDLGTTFVLLVILLALLWVIGTPGRLFACMLGLIVFALLVLIVVKSYRANRFTEFLNQNGDPVGPNMQSIQGKLAIGSGGLFGVGLGESMQKWGWVPNASSDFIFAILGEELGLIGTTVVVFLYGGLAYAGLRVARRMTSPFMRLAAAGITVWIVVQALVNICAVVGLLPITGVPLPLISQGLSSLLVTMAAVGVLLSLARREPGAREALAAGGPNLLARLARSFRSSPPAGSKPGQVATRAPAGAARPRLADRGGSRSKKPAVQNPGGGRGA
ncbi:MAG TPA: putative lipid II flippase FtsW [Streptosporangiaceae bacterium]|nr:putative lipid II flippase FtsW [Streptosporangiaceae bacterium]